MPAPRLLDKKTANIEVANQKRQQIDVGVKLAKSVDALREAKSLEEKTLEIFRTETIRKVQSEIDAKISEKDNLETANALLREERIRLSAPIDLSQAWAEVKTDKKELSEAKERLSQETIEVLAKQNDLDTSLVLLKKQRVESAKKEELAERTLVEAEQTLVQAETTLIGAKEEAKNILKDARHKENNLRVREEDATIREQLLTGREKSVEEHETDLSVREIKLRTNQELFIKAQAYIKSKK